MNGKATLLVVAGFSLIFLVVGKNLGNISSRAVDNSVEYYNQTVAHELAVSSANLAASQIFFDNGWDKGFSNVTLKGGKIKTTVQVIDVVKNIKKITATGEYQNKIHTVEVVFAPSSFSKFAYMSTNDPSNLYWTNADTIYGPFHSQGDINAYKHPVFWGKATTKGKVKYKDSENQDKPYFYGGFEQGVDLPLISNGVSSVENAATSGGKVFTINSTETFYLTFKQDSISYKIVKSNGTILSQQTVLSTSFSPNGVVYIKGGDVRMQGTVKGQFTIGVEKTVYLDDNLVYKSDPRINPNSTDILGIVAKNNVLITDNAANRNDINIHASIFSENGGFGAGWNDFLVNCGKINLLGGIQNKARVQIGKINGGNLLGFTRAYKYDDRLALISPPFYPGTGIYEIVSWKE